jgi:S1-C subfamily serine protease
VNGKSVSTAEDFVDAVSAVREGQPLKLVVKNEESDQMITIR